MEESLPQLSLRATQVLCFYHPVPTFPQAFLSPREAEGGYSLLTRTTTVQEALGGSKQVPAVCPRAAGDEGE